MNCTRCSKELTVIDYLQKFKRESFTNTRNRIHYCSNCDRLYKLNPFVIEDYDSVILSPNLLIEFKILFACAGEMWEEVRKGDILENCLPQKFLRYRDP